MKNYFFILLMLISVGCSRKQRYNELVWYGNFGVQVPLIINADCPFLTDDQFNQAILDTTKMYKFDRNTSIQLLTTIQRLDYKYRWDDPDLDMYHKMVIEDSTMFLYCMGRLNLQPDLNSLIVIKSFTTPFNVEFGNPLLLLNIKNNQICSVIKLINSIHINAPLSPSICIKNKIFKKSEMETDYWFHKNLGQRFPRKKDKEVFSTFTINESGFFVFTKGKRVLDKRTIIID